MKKAASLVAVMGFLMMAVTSMSSCSKSNSDAPPAQPTLYDSLGGTVMVQDPTAASGTKIEQGRLTIRSIIDSTIFVIAGDSRINGHFTTLLAEVGNGNLSGFQTLSKNLTDFVAVGTGAKNYSYKGLSMKAAHDPAQNPRMNKKATNADMDAFEADLVAGAAKNGVTTSNKALVSVANIVASLRSVVVQP